MVSPLRDVPPTVIGPERQMASKKNTSQSFCLSWKGAKKERLTCTRPSYPDGLSDRDQTLVQPDDRTLSLYSNLHGRTL